ncbi:formate/nitrite transporter family protein [Halocatena marina]|uniref:formate/nitrite transporter family protein n=1 Tax=Halocatena marina TaxID=2934937 RepID=UPI00200D9821|nr:formate/nitrite transporter family protein [Halocatena marina]
MGNRSVDPSDTQKSYNQVLAQEIRAGLREFNRSSSSLFLSAVSAGLDLGFTLIAVAAVATLAHGQSELVSQLLTANAYTVGFIFVILGRSELFTEHTTLAVLPVLDRQRSIWDLASTWGIIYAGNILGGLIFAGFAVVIGPEFGIFELSVLGKIVAPYTTHSTLGLFGGAVLAGWLMGLLSWLVTAVRDSSGRIFFVWFTTLLIGFTHLPHSIAGHIEMTAAVLATPLGIGAYSHFLLVATLGNAIGGVFFVALVKYGHVARGSTGETGLTGGYMQVYEQSQQSGENEKGAVNED